MGQPAPQSQVLVRARRRQVHIYLSDREYLRVQKLAEVYDETISGLLRRLLRDVGQPKAVILKPPYGQ
jgi:hypothetical protein